MISMRNIQRLIMANMPMTDEALSKLNNQEQRAWLMRQIKSLKAQLNSEDYKIIKCYECSLLAMGAPYDVAALHAEREVIRAEINELEQSLAAVGGEQ